MLVAHRAPLVAGAAEHLTCVSEHARWTTTFEKPLLAKASQLFVGHDLIVLVGEGPCEAVALDTASGAVRWRAKL